MSRFPAYPDKERLAALPDIQWEKVVLSPDEAMKAAGATRYPRDLRLAMLADEPVYRIAAWDGKRQAISAVDGRVITGVSEQQALAIVQHHPASRSPQLEEIVDRDQWSVTARYNPLRPLYLIALGDEAGTKLYVSLRSGEIALDTTRTERIWNWLGSIPPLDLSDGAAPGRTVMAIRGAVDLRHLPDRRRHRHLDRHPACASESGAMPAAGSRPIVAGWHGTTSPA